MKSKSILQPFSNCIDVSSITSITIDLAVATVD